jgi:hypothetical protein
MAMKTAIFELSSKDKSEIEIEIETSEMTI